jgi:hypothetical protein
VSQLIPGVGLVDLTSAQLIPGVGVVQETQSASGATTVTATTALLSIEGLPAALQAVLTANTATLNIEGVKADIAAAGTVDAATGEISLEGVPASLAATLQAAQSVLAIEGVPASLAATLQAALGELSVEGVPASLIAPATITANVAGLSIEGLQATIQAFAATTDTGAGAGGRKKRQKLPYYELPEGKNDYGPERVELESIHAKPIPVAESPKQVQPGRREKKPAVAQVRVAELAQLEDRMASVEATAARLEPMLEAKRQYQLDQDNLQAIAIALLMTA